MLCSAGWARWRADGRAAFWACAQCGGQSNEVLENEPVNKATKIFVATSPAAARYLPPQAANMRQQAQTPMPVQKRPVPAQALGAGVSSVPSDGNERFTGGCTHHL